MCKTNKALRNTARAYLKTAEKKRADERTKAEAGNAAVPPSAPSEEGNLAEQSQLDGAQKRETHIRAGDANSGATNAGLPVAEQAQPSIEVSLLLFGFEGISLKSK